jgi:hypothetical protein
VLGVALAVLALSALAAGAYVYVTAARPPVFDRASLCPVDGARSMTVVLLDSTDEIPDIGKREIRTVLLDMAETVPVYGLLSCGCSIPRRPAAGQIFAKCNPGDGSGLSEYTANPALAKRRWLEGFRRPLGRILGHRRPADARQDIADHGDRSTG